MKKVIFLSIVLLTVLSACKKSNDAVVLTPAPQVWIRDNAYTGYPDSIIITKTQISKWVGGQWVYYYTVGSYTSTTFNIRRVLFGFEVDKGTGYFSGNSLYINSQMFDLNTDSTVVGANINCKWNK
jgi:hypothetical protein